MAYPVSFVEEAGLFFAVPASIACNKAPMTAPAKQYSRGHRGLSRSFHPKI